RSTAALSSRSAHRQPAMSCRQLPMCRQVVVSYLPSLMSRQAVVTLHLVPQVVAMLRQAMLLQVMLRQAMLRQAMLRQATLHLLRPVAVTPRQALLVVAL
ncbi:hypothetical protein GGH13_009068, partial [Coemansia sp. S155-1]